ELWLLAGVELGHQRLGHINYLDKSKSSPLHLAVRGGNIEAIYFCIANGAKIDQQQGSVAPVGGEGGEQFASWNDKSTPLHLACTQGAFEVVKMMLSSYGPVEDVINLADGAHQTPLHRSAYQLVLTTGATIFDHTELAEYLISLGADINCVDYKGNSPLLLATSCGAWKTVSLLLSKGASVDVRDACGCNFLHLAILQPKGLKNIPEEVLQHNSVKALLSCEDNEGCTPLHYACRLGVHDSVKNMLGLSGKDGLAYKSKDKKSALHFAAQYGRINTCHRLLETVTDSRLLNEGDERGLTPLHLASKEGHTKVVELLLRRGALFHSDYKGWTCLHHAANAGFTQTMDILLSTNPKLLDKSDEDGNTALHLAAREGHVAAVKLLLTRGATLVLNKNYTSFLHEALQNGRKDVVNAVIDSDKCAEALTLFETNSTQRCPIVDMIEMLPDTYKVGPMPLCFLQIEYSFRWLQTPLEKRLWEKNGYRPLAAVNAMVHYNRLELLNHPVCKKYLAMKWVAYGSKAHFLNILLYLLGLMPLTYLIVSLRPSMSTYGPGHHNITMVKVSFKEQSLLLSFCMMMVLVMGIYAIIKELVQISQQRLKYFKDPSNQLDWCSAILSLSFIIPFMLNVEGSLHWQAGPMAVLNSWIGLLLYLQRIWNPLSCIFSLGRFEGVGIYVVMLWEIMKTLIRVVMLFFFLMIAFSLAFYALMLNQKEFQTVPLSVMQTFVMMVGELNYQNNILDPYLKDELPFSFLTYLTLVNFIVVMPILLVNLMIGLAVGDIAEVQRNASLKRIAMQIELHTALEERLPYWFVKQVDKNSITVYPNRKCSKNYISNLITGIDETDEVWSRVQAKSQQCSQLQSELKKQKHRMKEMSGMLEKQHCLLKLIMQKMEISSEADEYDGPVNLRGSMWPSVSKTNRGGRTQSRWVPLMKAIEHKK
ncbi:unnamed protein product, partial [Tetraodon nigroviridis]